MSNEIDIPKLAKLARIDLNEDNVDELEDNIESVLTYVSSVQEVADEVDGTEAGIVRNVLREDGEPHDPEAYRKALLREAPDVDENGFIVVPPIL